MNKNHVFRSFSLRFKHFIKTRPVFLFLLPVFFVLHGFNSNYNSVPAANALLLTLLYIGSSLVIAGISWFFYRDLIKACIIAFFLTAYNFFFGAMQDTLTNLSSQGFISQYRFILPVSCLCFLLIAIWLKKRKKTLFTFTSYLNILLLVLILIDGGWVVTKLSGPQKNTTLNPGTINFTACDTCRKPDIYLILLDQYAGSTALKEVFNFDNAAFEKELDRRGFYIAKNSISNYNLTPFSMASTLNMDYLTSEMGVKKHLNVGYSYQLIRNSRVIQFLLDNGYQFCNNSVFDFPGQRAKKYSAFFPYGTNLITMQTFASRLVRDIRSGILRGNLGFKAVQKKIAYEYLHFNDDIFDLTRNIASEKTPAPKFVYAHFIMPHYPYYFDSKGKPVSLEKLTVPKITNSNDYIEYLQYCNNRILELVDHLITASPNPPVIMLLSDHGFRPPEKSADRKYDFMNLNAIYSPDGNYTWFNDSLTNVNHFRVFFNSYFNQHLPLLKDSTIDLWD